MPAPYEARTRQEIEARDKERQMQSQSAKSTNQEQRYEQDLENARNKVVKKVVTMTSMSHKMRDILKKHPELGDEWVKKQLDNEGKTLLYFNGVADALRKDQVASEKSYVKSSGWQDFNKDNQEAKNKAAEKYGGKTIEYHSRLSPEARDFEKKAIGVSQQPILDILSQMGQQPFGQQQMQDILSALGGPQGMQQISDFYQNGPSDYDIPSWMPSGQDMYGGLQSGLQGLYGGAKSGLEGLMGYGQSGMQGLQDLYNNWGNQQQMQNPMNQQQQMEQKLALLNNNNQYDPSTGLSGRIKQRRM